MRQLIFSWKIAERLKKGCAICVYSQDIIGTKPYHCMQASSSLPSELTFLDLYVHQQVKKVCKNNRLPRFKSKHQSVGFLLCVLFFAFLQATMLLLAH